MTPAPITIPPEALEAGLKAFWSSQVELTSAARFQAACLAMLSAWAGMHLGHQCTGCGGDPQIILPLPKESET